LTEEIILNIFIIGFFMPLISNVLSVRKIFNRALRDSLDMTARVVNQTVIITKKLANLGVSPVVNKRFKINFIF